jgi:hypothetical protein
MFEALGQKLDGDHLDLSYRHTDAWPKVGPGEGMPPSLWISVGDPVSGPGIQLGAMKSPPMDGDLWLDTHYHGSDQFRALVKGNFLLQGKRMEPGQFVYQESGVPYREGVIGNAPDELWMFAVHGDRRGARATVVRKDGGIFIDEDGIAEDQLDRYVSSPDDPYWQDLPGGSKGVKALSTTLTEKRGAYVWGNFSDTAAWRELADGVKASGGVFGNKDNGPIILTLQSGAERVAIPAATYDTEVVCVVTSGEASIGGQTYQAGEVRVQKAGAKLDAVVAGPNGANIVFTIADRRAKPSLADNDVRTKAWKDAVDAVYSELAAA